MTKDTRARVWGFIVYPDSAPEDWQKALQMKFIPTAISPLHLFDNQGLPDEKKPHYHCMISFEGKKSEEQILEIISFLNCTKPQKINNPKGMLEYFIHKNNPEKEQFTWDQLVIFNGFDISQACKVTSLERYKLIKEMIQFCKDNVIIEFQDLVDYAIEYEFDTWFPLLSDNSSYILGQYIKSARHRHDAEIRQIRDKSRSDL